MSISIVQQDSFSVGSPLTSKTMTFFESQYGMKSVQAGHAIVVLWAGAYGNTLTALTDNYGNTYVPVSGAAFSDSDTGGASDIWWAQNVNQVTDPPTNFALNFTLSGSASGAWGAVVFEVSGINGATTVAGHVSVLDNNGALFNGPSLNGGGGAFYVTGTAGFAGSTATVASPWAILVTPDIGGGGGAATEFNGGQACATLVSSGTQQSVWTPDPTVGSNGGAFDGAVVGAAFIAASGPTPTADVPTDPYLGCVTLTDGGANPQPGQSSVPYLGCVRIVASAPARGTNPYLGNYTLVSAPPAGFPNPGPFLGEVTVVASPPNGAPAVQLGEVKQVN